MERVFHINGIDHFSYYNQDTVSMLLQTFSYSNFPISLNQTLEVTRMYAPNGIINQETQQAIDLFYTTINTINVREQRRNTSHHNLT